jgi:hypothetical protein
MYCFLVKIGLESESITVRAGSMRCAERQRVGATRGLGCIAIFIVCYAHMPRVSGAESRRRPTFDTDMA